MKNRILAIFVALILVCLFNPCFVTGAMRHHGDTNPETEGWNWIISPNPSVQPLVGPVDDNGVPAWNINDIHAGVNSYGGYLIHLSNDQNTDASQYGWLLRANVRVVNVPDSPEGSVMLYYKDLKKRWVMQFGATISGDPIVRLPNGNGNHTEIIVEGAGSTFNHYELIYDPLFKKANLFINGVERFKNYSGYTNSESSRVAWGSAAIDIGQANWNMVEFSINYDLPEWGISPSTGYYTDKQIIDLAVIIGPTTLLLEDISATLNGNDITTELNDCLVPGTLVLGGKNGSTYRCPDAFHGLYPSPKKFCVTLTWSKGAPQTQCATWSIFTSTEP